jgi:hypothetical protein
VHADRPAVRDVPIADYWVWDLGWPCEFPVTYVASGVIRNTEWPDDAGHAVRGFSDSSNATAFSEAS